MKRLKLPGTDLTTTALGFGCSDLLGPKSHAEALHLLGTAYDAGIRHFDVARYYGYGDAEGILGNFLQSRREEVTITTKFGINPARPFPGRRLLVDAVRKVMRLSPFVRRVVKSQANNAVEEGAFNPEDARESLETSLRELKTDYVDILLLHDCHPEHCRSEELLRFLEQAVEAGKVRYFGVGTRFDDVIRIFRETPDFASIMQFPNGVCQPNFRQLPGVGERTTITHGAMAGMREVHTYLSDHPATARRWSEQIGADCTDYCVLSALYLNYAVKDNSNGPVLFSSTKARHIRKNVSAVSASDVTAEQIEAFARLAADRVSMQGDAVA